MTSQVKYLKEALREIGATHSGSSKISVTCETKNLGRNQLGQNVIEYGYAVAHTDDLTEDQIKRLRELRPYAEIKNFPQYKFAIIKA